MVEYPYDEIRQALYDLMTVEFHDILPGSSIQPVEEDSLRVLDHGLEIVNRLKTRALSARVSILHVNRSNNDNDFKN